MNMMRKNRIYNIVLLLLATSGLLLSCSEKGSRGTGLFAGASGNPGELMLVIDNEVYDSRAGIQLTNLLVEDAEGLPQPEPLFRVSHVPPKSFSGALQRVRNILMVDVDDSRFSTTKLLYGYDEWADGQIVVRINTPNTDSLSSYVTRNGEALINLFSRHEIYRFVDYLAQQYSLPAQQKVDSLWGYLINVPEDIKSYKVGQDFLWMSNNRARKRHDLLVYSFPFTSKKDLSLDGLIEKRDSVLKANIEGEFDGSYPTTEKQFNVYYRRLVMPDGSNRYEVRGLWKMEGGAMMGGPFVSQAMLSSDKKNVLVVEGFVYNPNEKKLAMIRMMESSLYTFRPDSLREVDPKKVLGVKYTKLF